MQGIGKILYKCNNQQSSLQWSSLSSLRLPSAIATIVIVATAMRVVPQPRL
jgi:hypothetical protein